MDGFGFGGGGFGSGSGGKWDADDSARNFAEYHLVNGTNMDSGGGGTGKRVKSGKSKEEELVTGLILLGCWVGGTMGLAFLGMSWGLAVILAIPLAVAAGLVITVIAALVQVRRSRKRGAAQTDGGAPDEQ